MVLTSLHQPRILVNRLSVRDDPTVSADIIQHGLESSRAPVAGIIQRHAKNTTWKPDEIITITIHEYDPSSINSSFVSRRSHIKRRKCEP